MVRAVLEINLDAIAANWRALDRLSAPETQTAATVKSNAYGLGITRVARALAEAGARRFFVSDATEGVALRQILGPGPQIYLLSGHLPGEAESIRARELTPILSSLDQVTRHFEALPGQAFGLHLDLGMNRLGLPLAEWQAIAPIVLPAGPDLVMGHLSHADEPGAAQNEAQLRLFLQLTEGLSLPRSLAATGGLLLGRAYDFDLTRPGIGLYGGLPYAAARPAVALDLPVLQTRWITEGESVGYNGTYTAPGPRRIATLGAGYGDGLPRSLSNRAEVFAGETACPIVGRISMDAITADITGVEGNPEWLSILGPAQGIDRLARAAGTIGYEVLTSLGPRYQRRYLGGPKG